MSDKKHNDPLENFFKEKVSEHDISYREEDWLDLDKKLDEKAAYLARQKRIRLAAAAVILFMSLIGYFTYQNYNSINSLNDRLDDQITRNETPESQQESTPDLPQTDSEADPSEETNEIKVPKQVDPVNDPIAQVTNEEEPNSENEDETTGLNRPIDQDVTFISGLNERLAIVLAQKEDSKLPALSSGAHVPDMPLYATASKNSAHNRFIDMGNRLSENEFRSRASRFDIGFVVSPDLSTAGGIRQFEQPGYKFGLKTSYQLTSNISIQTGIIQSSVRYSSGIQNYDPPSYGNQSDNISSIFAECMILDIPISLTYNFRNLTRSRFFVSAGLSSYVMLSEDYTFSYEYSYTGQESNYSERSGKTHLFSNTGFSIGYEYDIRKNWSISAEPFIKIPLKEVGWGNARLYTIGTFVSVSYRL